MLPRGSSRPSFMQVSHQVACLLPKSAGWSHEPVLDDRGLCAPWMAPAAQVLAATPTGSMVMASLAMGFTRMTLAHRVASKPCPHTSAVKKWMSSTDKQHRPSQQYLTDVYFLAILPERLRTRRSHSTPTNHLQFPVSSQTWHRGLRESLGFQLGCL